MGACALHGSISACEPERVPDSGFIDEIVFDARQSDALQFAETAAVLGANTRAIRGEVTDRCFEDLYALWRTKRAPVAGLTDFRTLFLLQRMAADVGLQPVLRIHHGIRAGTAVHEAFGAQAYRAACDEYFARCGECWGRDAARLVVHLSRDLAGAPRHSGNIGAANRQALGSRALVTWMLA